MYLLKIISLINCPYSNAAKEFLDEKGINYKLISVNSQDKEKYKNKNISTFPQIYLYKKNKPEILLGGYDDIVELYQKTYKVDMEEAISYLDEKHKRNNLSRKNKLRILKIFN